MSASDKFGIHYLVASLLIGSKVPYWLSYARFLIVCQVSAAVMFLLSPGASFISGDTIKVDGAHSLYRPSMPWDINGLFLYRNNL